MIDYQACMDSRLELVYCMDGDKKTIFYGPSTVERVSGFDTFSASQKGIELRKNLLTRYQALTNNYILWFKNQNKYHLKEGLTIKEFDVFPELATDKVFMVYQMILDILSIEGDWERRIMDYAIYINESFGSIPCQNGSVLFKECVTADVIELVMNDKSIHNEAKNVIASTLIHELEKHEMTEVIDELITAFEKWKNTLPIELDFLNIKDKKISFQDIAIYPDSIINEFNEELYYRVRTKEEMIDELLKQTFDIFRNIELSSATFDNPAEDALSISENKTKLQLAKISQQYDQSEINYLDAIIQSLHVIEEHLVKHKDTLITHKTKFNEKLNGKESLSLTISEAALFFVFSEVHITRENANFYIKRFGHNSGEKLFQKYTFWSSRSNRINPPSPNTKKKFENKITLFEKVLGCLDEKHLEQAMDELNILKIKYEDDHL